MKKYFKKEHIYGILYVVKRRTVLLMLFGAYLFAFFLVKREVSLMKKMRGP